VQSDRSAERSIVDCSNEAVFDVQRASLRSGRRDIPHRTRSTGATSHGELVMDDHQATARPRSRQTTAPAPKMEAREQLAEGLNLLLADLFALYLKTKNFHWHVRGPHFRDYHLLLDEQADQIYAITDPVAERVRKIGGRTLRSIGDIARLQRVVDNDTDEVPPLAMLTELRRDNEALRENMKLLHDACAENGDVATASLLEVWIDEAERRSWFLIEATRSDSMTGSG
jgi:starvation-inducible DNA-binding protein